MTEDALGGRYYDQPYRGLPSEVRLMIWKFMIPSSVEMTYKAEEPQSALRPIAGSDIHYLNLLQVNSEVRMEALKVMRSSTIFDCRAGKPLALVSGLNSLPAHIRAMMKGVRIEHGLVRLKQLLIWNPDYLYSLLTQTGISELEWVIDMGLAMPGDEFHLPEEEPSCSLAWDDTSRSWHLCQNDFLMKYIVWAVKNHLISMIVTIDNLRSNSVEEFLMDITGEVGEDQVVTAAYSRARWENFQAQHGVFVDITNNEEHKKADERNQLILVAKRAIVDH